MAHLVCLYNPLDTSRRRRYVLEDGTPLLAWMDEHEPVAGRGTRVVFVNGLTFDPHTLDEAAYRTQPGDEILVAFRPGTGVEILPIIIQALVSLAIGYVLSQIFAPSRPKAGNTPSPSQVYGIAPARNAARIGQPIPVIYGSVIALPDFAAQPYVEYAGNDQYLYALLCLGQGEFSVSEMMLGDSSAKFLPPEVATYTVFGPDDHGSVFGRIQIATGVRENVVTSADVSNQELLAPNETGVTTPSTWYWQATNVRNTAAVTGTDLTGLATDAQRLAALPASPALYTKVTATYSKLDDGSNPVVYTVVDYVAVAFSPDTVVPQYSLVPPPAGGAPSTKWVGPFETCKAGQKGQSLELDFVFASGLYTMDKSGNLNSRSVTLTIERTPIDDAGNATAGPTTTTVTFTASSNTAQRYTHKIPASGRYKVRVSRATNTDGKTSTGDRCIWAGLKFQLNATPVGTPVYGNVTLIAVKLKASNGVASDAASAIRFRVTRKLTNPAGTTDLAATVNPADAFADIVCAPYGGNRPRTNDELDLMVLAASRTRWASHNGFNAIFDQPSTVWEALQLSVQTVSAAPLPIGSRLSLVQDGVQPVRVQMFTDANIAKGSLQIQHAFDRDGTPEGIRVEYRDARTFSQAAYLLPVGAPDYESIDLFGCTDAAVAAEHATLAKNRRELQRTSVTFVTELEGLSCLPGDRIGVQATMARWAQSARVSSVSGLTLTVTRPLSWTLGATHAVQLRDATGKPVKVSPVTRGASDFEVVCPSLPFTPVGFGEASEPTLLSFGIEGQEITDWMVTAMQPQGTTVQIAAVNYDPAVWDNAAAHLKVPLGVEVERML